MVNTCCAYDCKTCSDINTEIMFHTFPDPVKDKDRWQKWVNAIKRKGFIPSASARLCSLHFKESDYNPPVVCGPPRLKKDAVPSVFCYLDQMTPKRTLGRQRLIQINPNGICKETANIIQEVIVTIPTTKSSSKTVATQTDLVGVELTSRIEQLTQTINRLRRDKKTLQQQLRRREIQVNNLNEKLIKVIEDNSSIHEIIDEI